MSVALGAGALLLGLASTPHCVAMCAAACGGVARACGGEHPQRAMAALQLGRLLGYSLAGALAAASVSTLGQWASQAPAWRPLWSLVHLGALVLGLWLAWRGHPPGWMQAAGQALSRWARHGADAPGAKPSRGLWRAGQLGLGWVLLPCGMLHAALLAAAMAPSAGQGAWVMACFAVGSGVGVWAGPAIWWRFSGGRLDARQGPDLAVRLGGGALAAMSAWALGLAFWHRFSPVFC